MTNVYWLMKYRKEDIELKVRQISDILLINGGFLNNPGLFSGEMGIVLFFTRYARLTQNDLYLDYAFGLIEKLQCSINQDTPINYRHGLAGIGSAIEYLVQNGYFEADTDEVLEDFDKWIVLTRNLSYLSINEIKDIGYYASWRISGNSSKKETIMKIILPQLEKHSIMPDLLRTNNTNSFREKTYNSCMELIAKNNFWYNELGLQNGLAGWGLSLLTELDEDDSWFSLFPNDFCSTPTNQLIINH